MSDTREECKVCGEADVCTQCGHCVNCEQQSYEAADTIEAQAELMAEIMKERDHAIAVAQSKQDSLVECLESQQRDAKRISELEAIIMKERDALVNDIKILAELHATINGSPPKGEGE